ncbi:MAG: DUF4129 domain-containing protein [Candidatus Bipolaricaulota bacterium]|nr:DUF4129 domain-containing protein [Candidatus Bipolaricaulota bacterium]
MRKRLWVPLAALGALIVLAAGLSQVSFVGTRYELPSETSPSPEQLPLPEAPPPSPTDPPWWTDLILIAAGTLLLASVVFLIINPKDLKEVLRRAVALSLWVIALYFIIRRLREISPIETPPEPSQESFALPPGPVEALPSFEQFQIPPWVTFFLVLAALVIIALLAYLLVRLGRRRSPEYLSLREELAVISQRTAEELRAGASLNETILRCYREMCHLLSEHTQIALGRAMTAREFERALAAVGIQEAHIERLSRLFEWARYSNQKPSPTHEQEAISALEAIARRYGTASISL